MTVNRRSILGTLGKAFAAGGLLLPFSGQSALALPVDLGPAAKVPLTPAAVPLSQEGRDLRYLRKQLFKIQHGMMEDKRYATAWGDTEFTRLMVDEYQPRMKAIAQRPAPTFADCVELAEILWHYLPKDDDIYDGVPGALSISSADWQHGGAHGCKEVLVALVEALLTLGHGERWDPRLPKGFYPDGARAPEKKEVRVRGVLLSDLRSGKAKLPPPPRPGDLDQHGRQLR